MSPLRPTTRTLATFLKASTRRHSTSSVSANELSHFSSLASSWWDPMGPSRVLHLMNPLRHDFIASCLADCPPPQEEGRQGRGLHYLDVGCGGGIFAESMARTIPVDNGTATAVGGSGGNTTAASVTAIDPTPTLIQIAQSHARTDPKVDTHLRAGRFQYQNRTLEDLVQAQQESGAQTTSSSSSSSGYDVVSLFEVLEHIDPDPGASAPQNFLTNCLRLVKPGGWLVGSTIARTFPSWIVNQVIAEAPWPVGVVPRGTHEWAKFVNPGEVRGWVEEGLMRGLDGGAKRAGPEALTGMRWICEGVVYFPGVGWKIMKGSEDWGNYFWAVRKGV